MSHPWHRLL
jgi:transcription elongation factor Elf1